MRHSQGSYWGFQPWSWPTQRWSSVLAVCEVGGLPGPESVSASWLGAAPQPLIAQAFLCGLLSHSGPQRVPWMHACAGMCSVCPPRAIRLAVSCYLPSRKVHPPSALVPHVPGEPVLPVWLPQCSLGMAAALLVRPLLSALLHTRVDSVGECGQALRQPRNGAVVVHRPPGLGQREGALAGESC